MAGLSVKQVASFLNVDLANTRNLMRRNCNVVYTERGEQRTPIDDFVQFLLNKPQYQARFVHNYELKQIEAPYQVSADIVYQRLQEVKETELSREMEFLSTNDILALPFYTGFESLRDISDCCMEGRMLAFKTRPDKNGRWRIPIESFAIYVDSHSDVVTSFSRAWTKYADKLRVNDAKRYKIMRSIDQALVRIDAYAVEQIPVAYLIPVLEMPQNQIETIFGVTASKRAVTSSALAMYLRHHPDLVANIWDQFQMLNNSSLPADRYQAAALLHVRIIYEYHLRTCLRQFAKIAATIIEERR